MAPLRTSTCGDPHSHLATTCGHRSQKLGVFRGKRVVSAPEIHSHSYKYISRGSTLQSSLRDDSSASGEVTSSSSSTRVVVVSEFDERQDDQKQSQSAFLSAFSASGQSDRDLEGRSLAGKKKPLKINLDLALYRARQTRIMSNRVSSTKDRVKLAREAEQSLKKCIDMDPEDGRAYVILGKMLTQERRYDEAEALYDSGCAATKGVNPFLWTAWANLAIKRGNVALARKLFDAAIVANSKHAAAYHGWGLLEKRNGNYTRARDIWIRGIDATRPDGSPYLFQSLAVLAAEMSKPDEARRWFREGTLGNSGKESHAIWHAWACMEVKQGSDEHIIRQLFQNGLKSSPKSRYTFLSWALWEKDLGNINQARALFKKGTSLNRSDAALPQAWALMEESLGNLEEARRLFKKASRADSKHLYVWQAWGCMEQRANNVEVARELFQHGVWAAPPRAKATSMVFQAWALLEQNEGNFELARELYKCAVKADPQSEPSWLAWAQMEEELGLYNRASELRNFSMQEKQIIQTPSNFTTLKSMDDKGLLDKALDTLGKWFDRYERYESKIPIE
jgi:tetratricopeptide (TPR) repeat protein